MKKVLLIGGNGFIGRNIIEYFSTSMKYQIIAPTSKELNCIDEVAVTEYLKANNFDIVLHFAVWGDKIDIFKEGHLRLENNLRMFLNFEKNSHLYGKMYYAGSGAEYDKSKNIVEVKEDDVGKSIPIDWYGLMRYTVDRLVRRSDNIYCLNIFGLFGKYEPWERRFISNCCCKAIKGLPLSIRQNVFFDYMWIEDFLDILESFMDITPLYHIYNFTTGKKIDLHSLAEIVLKISGKELPIYICKEGMGNEYSADNSRLISELGGYTFTKVEVAVEKLYKWYLDNEHIIDVAKLLYQ